MSNRTFSTKTVLALVLAAVPLTACDSLFNIVDDLRDGLADAEIDLAQAVAKAEAEVPSGTIVDAEFEFEHNRLQYRFVIWQDGNEVRLELAADDGSVLKHRTEAVDADDAAELSAQALIVESASLSFVDAIAIAEDATGGTAFEVEADDGVFEVEVLIGDVVRELDIDPDTGAVLKDQPSDDWADDGDDDDDSDGDDDSDDDDSDDDDSDSDDDETDEDEDDETEEDEADDETDEDEADDETEEDEADDETEEDEADETEDEDEADETDEDEADETEEG